MKAIRPHQRDGSLELVDVDEPRAGAGEVLIQVARAGVNFSDVVGPRVGFNR